MKHFIIFFAFFMLVSCAKKDFLFEVGREVSITALENLLDTKVNLDKDSITIQSNVSTEKACKILSQGICAKLTHSGYLHFSNELVTTKLLWVKKDEITTAIFFERVKAKKK